MPLYVLGVILLLWGERSGHSFKRIIFWLVLSPNISSIPRAINRLFRWDKAQKDERLSAQLSVSVGCYFSSLNGDKTVGYFVPCPWFTLSFSWRAVDHDSGPTEPSVEFSSPKAEQEFLVLDSRNHLALSLCCWQICMEFVLQPYQVCFPERQV